MACNWPDNPFDHVWSYLVIPFAKLWFNPRNVKQQTCWSPDLSIYFVYERTGKFYSLLNYNFDEKFRRIYFVQRFPLADTSIFLFKLINFLFGSFNSLKMRELYRWILFYACATSPLSLEKSNKRRNRADLALDFILSLL